MNKLANIIAQVEFDRAIEIFNQLEESREFLENLKNDTEIPDNVIQVDFVNKKRLE